VLKEYQRGLNMSVRVRFAPSPTGHIHVGNVRTALFNYLFAKNKGGKFILRIEDTDLERSSLESENLIYEDLNWLGFEWDEGPKQGGDFGPYRQTERIGLYNEYAEKLLTSGHAYKCYCTKEELDAEREEAAKNKQTYKYSKRCRNLTSEQIEQFEAEGREASIRFKVDADVIPVDDMVKGLVEFKTDAIGDFVIVRQGGVPIYNFVCVIDDALMNITHVIRGDDHHINTPKQKIIYDALGFELPQFAHIPMILGEDKSKLSKRHGNTSVEQFRNQGYLAEALFNFLALLSWSHPEEKEILTPEELFEVFSLDRVSNSAAVFDFGKLKWMNGQYIRALDVEKLAELAAPFAISSGVLTDEFVNNENEKYLSMIASVQDKLELLADVSEQIEVFVKYTEPGDDCADVLGMETTPAVLKAFKDKLAGSESITAEEYKVITKEIQKETGAKGKALFMALRIGMSGKTKGSDLDKIATILNAVEITERLEKTLSFIG